MRQRIAAGVLAGAAGTTALNVVTYADMALRGRPASAIPEQVAGRLTGAGDEDGTAAHRRQGIAALLGFAVGLGVGAAYGLAGGGRFGITVGALGLAAAAALGGDGPPVALGLTDPRTWPAGAWASDVVPHLAYGVVTAVAYEALTREAR
jgi:hypothetical protein